MDLRLRTMAAMQEGVFTFEEATRLGLTGNDLTALVRSGQVTRLRHRAYVLSDVYAAASPDAQYRLRVHAVLRSRPPRPRGLPDRASHHSALALHGISFFKAPRDVVVVESQSGPQAVRGGMRLLSQSDADTYRYGDVRLVGAEAACVQVAARDGFEAGVCAMDSALHLGKCTIEGLAAAVELVPAARRRRVRAAVEAADARSESIGESRTRIILLDAGFAVIPQFEVREGRTLLGRVDFLVDGCVVVEFDGLMKYEGIEGKVAIGADKDREKRIRRLGYEFVRIVWRELDDPVSIARHVAEAKRDAQRRSVLAVR